MRRAIKVAAVATAAAGTVCAAGGAASAAPSHEAFQLRAHGLTFHYNGPNPNVPKPGYAFSFTEALYPTNSKTRVGTDYVNCDIITKARDLCTASFVLNGRGQIVAEGSIPFNTRPGQVFALAVTGGTGEFKGMTGTVRITSTSDNAYYTPQAFNLSR